MGAAGANPVEDAPATNTPLSYAVEACINNTSLIGAAVEDFASNFDVNDTAALKTYVADIAKNKMAAAGFKEGFDATVTVLKANEAILKGQKIVFEQEWFAIR